MYSNDPIHWRANQRIDAHPWRYLVAGMIVALIVGACIWAYLEPIPVLSKMEPRILYQVP